jgi:formyltetrahydrofolate deformylase
VQTTLSSRHVLLISCSDERGLIHRITAVLFKHGLNIIENSEFVDHVHERFFMRTEIAGDLPPELTRTLIGELQGQLPSGAVIDFRAQAPKRLVLLATKEHHCLGDLLLRHWAKELKAQVLAVVSQYDSLKGLVDRFDLPFHHVPVRGGQTREEHETDLLSAITPYQPDFVVLAKYMRVLSPSFVKKFESRIINIHHSFLPAFVGSNPYLQAYERGVKIIGATAHFVNEDLDEGPIITQSVIPINHTQDAAALARAGKDVERIVLAKALNLVLEDRIIVQGRKTLIFE